MTDCASLIHCVDCSHYSECLNVGGRRCPALNKEEKPDGCCNDIGNFGMVGCWCDEEYREKCDFRLEGKT